IVLQRNNDGVILPEISMAAKVLAVKPEIAQQGRVFYGNSQMDKIHNPHNVPLSEMTITTRADNLTFADLVLAHLNNKPLEVTQLPIDDFNALIELKNTYDELAKSEEGKKPGFFSFGTPAKDNLAATENVRK